VLDEFFGRVGVRRGEFRGHPSRCRAPEHPSFTGGLS
jgi:hypothetical protein